MRKKQYSFYKTKKRIIFQYEMGNKVPVKFNIA